MGLLLVTRLLPAGDQVAVRAVHAAAAAMQADLGAQAEANLHALTYLSTAPLEEEEGGGGGGGAGGAVGTLVAVGGVV